MIFYEREREVWRVLVDRITQGMPLAAAYNPGHDRSDTLSYSLEHYCGRLNTNPHTSKTVSDAFAVLFATNDQTTSHMHSRTVYLLSSVAVHWQTHTCMHT